MKESQPYETSATFLSERRRHRRHEPCNPGLHADSGSNGGSAGSSGGAAGSGAAAGSAGSSAAGNGGAAGSAGDAGASGSGGVAGSAGASGSAGMAGSTGSAGSVGGATQGPGVDGSKPMAGLSDEEAKTLCEWTVQVQGGERTVDCGNGVKVTVDSVASCLSLRPQWPMCGVDLYAACVAAQAKDLCASSPPECKAFYDYVGAQ